MTTYLCNTTGAVSRAASASLRTTPQQHICITGTIVFIAVLGAAVWSFPATGGPQTTPIEGIGVFALFYVVAQAAERAVELITPAFEWFPSLTKERPAKKRNIAIAADDPQAAADGQADVDGATVNRRAITFALTASFGMMLCGYLQADFLTTVGVRFGTDSLPIEVLKLAITGLIIGGGSDGLHNLVSNISKASAKKDTPAATGGTA